MAGGNQSQERTEEATPKKRQDERKKGHVNKSQDVVQAAGLLAAALTLPGVVAALGESMTLALTNTTLSMPRDVSIPTLVRHIGVVTGPIVLATLPLLGAILVVGVVASLSQVGLLWSMEAIKPSWQKLNPLEGFKRIFGKRAAFEGFKATAKMAIFAWIAYAAISGEWQRLVTLAMLPPDEGFRLISVVGQTILFRMAMVWAGIAALDFAFQRKQYEDQIKMTIQELKQEMKDQEGAPEIKMARHQRRRQLAKGSLAAAIQKADVVITNPTHFAVALEYDRSRMHAPMVVAKGQDYLALKIRELAAKDGVPMVENKPLARSLYAKCEAGDYIPRELFAGVAEVLAYVYKTVERVRRKAS